MARVLTKDAAALIRGMVERGDPKQEIAQYFGVNSGRLYPILQGAKFASVAPAHPERLPPPGPYKVVSAVSYDLMNTLIGKIDVAVQELTKDLASEVARLKSEAGVNSDDY